MITIGRRLLWCTTRGFYGVVVLNEEIDQHGTVLVGLDDGTTVRPQASALIALAGAGTSSIWGWN